MINFYCSEFDRYKEGESVDMVKGITDFIANNPGMIAIGWLATVLGLIVAIATPIITRKKKRLSYAYDSTQLVEAEVAKANNIQVLFNNRPIERLCVTKFVIKNSGNTTVRWESMHRNHKLKIIGADVQIISVTIEDVSRDIVTEAKEIEPINHAKDTKILEDIRDLGAIDPNDEYGVIPINFEAFEKKDYMILNIYHTGGIDTIFNLVGEDENLKIVADINYYDVLSGILLDPHMLSLFDSARLVARIMAKKLAQQ